MAPAVPRSSHSEIQEVHSHALAGPSGIWGFEQPSRMCNFKSTNEHQEQYISTDYSDSRATPSLELSKSSQTATTTGNEGLNHSLAFRSTLIAGRRSSSFPLKFLNNQNTASVTNPSNGMVTPFMLQHTHKFEPQSESMAAVAASPPRSPYQNNGSPNRQVSDNSHPDWPNYTFVDIFVHGLPPNVSTLDLYKNFIQYGEIAIITIRNASGGAWRNQADIRFK